MVQDSLQVRVKHAGKTYDIELPHDASGLALKTALADRTNVSVGRQKILVKGKQLKSDVTLADAGLTQNQVLLMLGTPEEQNASAKMAATDWAAENARVSREAEAAAVEEAHRVPPGLVNMGNTCYASATLQALRKAPELADELKTYQGDNALVRALGHQVSTTTSAETATTPLVFMQALRSRMPQFAEVGEYGVPKQQDAEELWTLLMTEMKNAGVNGAHKLFDGEFVTTTRAVDDNATADVVGQEPFSKLNCHISARTNFLKDGLRAGLTEEIEKHSEEAGGDATFEVSKKISVLPKYLTVQFVRFFWRRDTNVSSKILRKVAFPLQLDIADLCTEDLQEQMVPVRDAYRLYESAEEEAKRAQRRAKFAENGDESIDKAKAEAAELKTKYDAARAATESTGVYELMAVVTHQGKSSDSGHYQCFTRNEKKPNSWWRFNDDRVTEVDDARIESLSGGGESDSALILLYRSV